MSRIHNHLSKPECKLIGEDGNIFNLIAIASKTLKKSYNDNDEKIQRQAQAKEMQEKVFNSLSYEEALGAIGQYVDIY